MYLIHVGHQDNSVCIHPFQQTQVPLLLFQIIIGVAERQAVSPAVTFLLHSSCQLIKKRIDDVRHQYADDFGRTLVKGPGHLIWFETGF